MSALPNFRGEAQIYSPAEYLAFERASDQHHEYRAGHIYAMAGASANHNLIVTNTIAALHTQLRQRPCLVYPSDMRVKVNRTGLYTYPDVSVVCGQPQFEDNTHDTLLNPIIIIEVLSPSTESYDRGKKFQQYRALPSLQEYVLIAQDSVHVEQYVRQPDNHWLLSDVSQTEGKIALPSIQSVFTITELYEKVTFEPEQP